MPLLRRNHPRRCPACGYQVTPFAAGCGLCGAELDPRRHRRGPGPRLPWSPSTPATYALMIVVGCVIVSTVAGLLFLALGSLR
ncbi:MAG: hypothetical protein QOG70_2967 [Solirubrobacteraceae bacterium]|jgi:hypothetical protein|nr:hypothetical protein [Solirubrobacteraceae bacterium]